MTAVSAQAKFDPAHRWRSATTAHFVIHFHEGCDELAGRAAQIAEEAHRRLVPRLGWTPRERTRLIIADDADEAGGWATPYPYNQILITPTAPLGEYGLGTTRYDDWLRLVITHEYTHVLQLDMASRLPLALRSVFGRLYFPNTLQPQWLIEGLATFEETELTAGGRGRSPGSAMVLRMAALEGPFPTLDQMAVLPDAWPAGQVPYLFGESFVRYLAGRFSREKLAHISQAYGGRPLPFLVESTGQEVLAAEYRTLWSDWVADLRARFREERRLVVSRGLTASTPLTDDARFNGSPAWSPDGKRIAWLRSNSRDYPGVWVMDADGSRRSRLVKSAFSTTTAASTLGWSPDGRRIYYTKPGFARGVAVVNDIWAWDFDRGREIRVTRGLRARDAHPSPDGRTLVLVTAERGLTQLALLDLDGPLPAHAPSRLRPLAGLSTDQYAEPRWSPDGQSIAVSTQLSGGEKEIRILDREGRLLARVGHGGALDGAPAWSSDGRRLFFSSDTTGIFNIFAWDATTHEIDQVTNVIGGAFAPAPAPDGRRLAFTDYTAKGYGIRVMDVNSADERKWNDGEQQRQDPAAGVAPAASIAATAYSPLDTILPRLWFPWAAYSPESGTLAGLITGGQDALQRHFYTLTALYGPDSGRLMHWLDYVYDGLRPTLRLSSSDFDRTHGALLRDAHGSADYTERLRSIGADVSLDLPGFEAGQLVTLGYRYRELSGLTALPPWPGYDGELPATGPLGSTRLAWSFSNAHRQQLSISPAGGRRVDVQLEHYQEGFGSDYTFTKASFDWNEYVSLPSPRHVLAARLFMGGANGGPPQIGAHSLGGGSPGDLDYASDEPRLLLRGYPPNAFRGEWAALGSLEYRFPLLDVGRGGVSAPFFLRRLHGAFFVDAGEAWSDGAFRPSELHAGVGAEIRLDLFVSYYVPLSVRLGIAAGLDEEGGLYPTLSIWIPQGLSGSTPRRQQR